MTKTRATRFGLAVVGLAAVGLVLAACTRTPPPPTISQSDTIDVGRSIAFASIDGQPLELDACIPKERSEGPFPAVVLVHGGAFEEGNRSNMLDLCRDLAGGGIAAFAIDYRLLPAVYPAQVEDTMAATAWLREPEQVDRFDIDPARLSLLGSSAGGIISLSAAERLAALGTPVASVVGLSAAGALTPDALTLGTPSPELQTVVLRYLGCDDIEDCAVAAEASPVTDAASLPPTLLYYGSEEIIPIQQGEALTAAIQQSGGTVTFQVVEGTRHGLSLLDDTERAAVAAFLIAAGT